MKAVYFVVCSLALGLFAIPAFAQFSSTVSVDALQSIEPDLTITLSPATPEAGEEVTAYLQTHTLNSAPRSITWTVNGATQSSATNQNTLTFTAGGLGTQMIVRASVTTSDGSSYSAQRTFTITQLDMIVDAKTTTPGFYQGRPEPSIGSEVKLTALLKNHNPANLTYTWKLNGTVLNSGPVRGGYAQVLTMPLGRSATVSVTIQDSTNTVIASKSMRLDATEPAVIFYEDNALRGVMKQALANNSTVVGSEITVRAEPYFISTVIPMQDMHREWAINGRTAGTNNQNQNSITLEKANTNSFLLEFHIRNLGQLLQGAKESIRLSF